MTLTAMKLHTLPTGNHCSLRPDKFGRMFAAKVTELGAAYLEIPAAVRQDLAAARDLPLACLDRQSKNNRAHGGKSIEVLPTQRLGLEDIYYQQNPANIQPAPLAQLVVFRLADYLAPARVIKVVMPTSVYGL